MFLGLQLVIFHMNLLICGVCKNVGVTQLNINYEQRSFHSVYYENGIVKMYKIIIMKLGVPTT